MEKLKGKVALVTGGSSGIGLATANLFYQQGADVIIVGRNLQKLESAASTIGENTKWISADLATLKGIETVVDCIKNDGLSIDILFANAGVSDAPELFETDEAGFDQMMSANVKSVFFLFTKAFPLFREGASVILTSSIAHFKGRPADALYAASKAAVRSFGRTFAMDEAVLARKVRVNVVSPGAVKTPLTRQDSEEMQHVIDEYITTSVPMQRWGEADEIAKAVLFLASDDSSYITGADLLVDGGWGQA